MFYASRGQEIPVMALTFGFGRPARQNSGLKDLMNTSLLQLIQT